MDLGETQKGSYNKAQSSYAILPMSAVEFVAIYYWKTVKYSRYHIHLQPSDKVSMLTPTYKRKPRRKIKVTVCNHRADSPFYVWPDVWSGDLQV